MSRTPGIKLASLAADAAFTLGAATAMAQYQQQPGYPPPPPQTAPPPKPSTPYPVPPPQQQPPGYPPGYPPPQGYPPPADPNAYPPGYPPPAPMPPPGPAHFAQKGQKLLSGRVSASFASNTLKDNDDATVSETASNDIQLEPGFGYFVADGFALGGLVLVDIANQEDKDPTTGDKAKSSSQTLGLGIDGTFHFVSSDHLGFFVGAQVAYASLKITSEGLDDITGSGPMAGAHGGAEFLFGGNGAWGVLSLGASVNYHSFSFEFGDLKGKDSGTAFMVDTGIGVAWE